MIFIYHKAMYLCSLNIYLDSHRVKTNVVTVQLQGDNAAAM